MDYLENALKTRKDTDISIRQIQGFILSVSLRHLNISVGFLLIRCDLVMPYGDIDMVQHWFGEWLVSW